MSAEFLPSPKAERTKADAAALAALHARVAEDAEPADRIALRRLAAGAPLVAEREAQLAARIVADSRDRVSWVRARSRGITATDVATLTSDNAIARAADAKLLGSSFSGNAYTAHGRAREPEIAAWIAATHGIRPSSALYHAVVEKRHLATPDGVTVDAAGRIVLAEIKTTNKSWRSIPRTYLRQVWWQQHVLGAERTLVAWEEHAEFVPIGDEPRCQWVDRDDREIAKLVALATSLIDELYRRTQSTRVAARSEPRERFRALALAEDRPTFR